jgi:preprotein translocase subunit SecE
MIISGISPSGWFLIRINKYMGKITNYIKEVIAEAKNVTWPTRNQTVFFTVAVLIISIVVAYYLGLLDYLFGQGLDFLLKR